ncbi:MAG: NUDIX hydrolase [Kordiimonadaceae bacterium]|nr:NUDIX hydrolase [Kordiimonadaceae bacterium]
MNDKSSIIDSASILVIRDNDVTGKLEVLMVKRHPDIGFAGGAYVFPGGKVDPDDLTLSRDIPFYPAGYSDFIYTAFREVFEESGLIIGNEGDAVEYRNALLQGEIAFSEIIKQANIIFNPDDIIPFARWVTPRQYLKRFDTRFYLAKAPQGQQVIPDFKEIIEAKWVEPIEFIDQFRNEIMFPTLMNLKLLGQASKVDEALDQARRRKIIKVEPKWTNGIPSIDPRAGYGELDYHGLYQGFKGDKV